MKDIKYVEPKNQHLNPKYQCVFCNSRRHSSHLCRKYTAYNGNEQFYNLVVKERRCKNCLRQFHQSDRCLDDSFCTIESCKRKDKHSPCVCRKRFPQSIWSELYNENISKFKKNVQPTIWSELYRHNVLNISTDKRSPNNSSLSNENVYTSSQENCIAQCLAVSTITKAGNLNSQGTQTENFNTQGTQTDEESCSSSAITSANFHSLDESEMMTSSSVNVSTSYEKFRLKLTDYFKVLCSIYWFIKFKNPICSNQFKVHDFNSTPIKDNFLNILT